MQGVFQPEHGFSEFSLDPVIGPVNPLRALDDACNLAAWDFKARSLGQDFDAFRQQGQSFGGHEKRPQAE